MPQLFERAIERIAKLEPDLFVLSGDLIDYPLDQMDSPSYQEQARADYRLIAGLLDRVACPMAIVYGNHDHPSVFRQVYESLQQDQLASGYRTLTFLDDEGDANVPERIGIEQQRFATVLADSESAPQIHIQHYLVWPELNKDYPHTYGAGADMRDSIFSSGVVRLALSGHYHTGVQPTLHKDVWFATVPAFGEAPHPYWVYELDGCDLTWAQHTMDETGLHA